MNVLVIGGFLGSGKTTILLQLAAYLNSISEKEKVSNENPNIVILENEIGNEGIDDKIISAQGYLVEVMTAGCICCLMMGSMLLTVEAIKKRFHPEWLIIEATGVADTTTIVRTIENRVNGIGGVSGIVVVDAERFDMIMSRLPGFLKGQIMHADTILLNKMDLLEPEKHEMLIAKINGLKNDFAKLFMTSASAHIPERVWKEIVIQNEEIARSYCDNDPDK